MPDAHANREERVLVLQGGGALGAYQGGVFQALQEARLEPDWVAGISIGAINSALIAGNPPERRVARLREFWETVSSALPGGVLSLDRIDGMFRAPINEASAVHALLFGVPGFFIPRVPPPQLQPEAPWRRSATTIRPRSRARCSASSISMCSMAVRCDCPLVR
jgi:NTE family protein